MWYIWCTEVPRTVSFASVTRKGIRPANVDFAALGGSLEGKNRIVWYSTTLMRSARIGASRKTWSYLSWSQKKERSSAPRYWNWDASKHTFAGRWNDHPYIGEVWDHNLSLIAYFPSYTLHLIRPAIDWLYTLNHNLSSSIIALVYYILSILLTFLWSITNTRPLPIMHTSDNSRTAV